MKSVKQNAKEKVKKNGGITLVALVVTIVVLLILAGVTINTILGDNGIITKAQDAKEKTIKSNTISEIQTEILIAQMDGDITQAKLEEILSKYAEGGATGILKDEDGNITGIKVEGLATAIPIEEIYNGTVIAKVTDLTTNFVTGGNKEAQDAYGNKIVVPEGFKVVLPDATNGVVYADSSKPCVTDGIVIEDEAGNQFVWIPVGRSIKKADNSTIEIKLARYNFDAKYDSSLVGTGEVLETIEDGRAFTPIGRDFTVLEELATSTTYNNTKAKNIEAFKTSVSENGGYYIARYEASYKDGTKPCSKPSTGTPAESSSTAKTEGMLWNWITQREAAEAAQAMYTNDNFTSDLINSYSWDTAIVFIQKSTGEVGYSKQKSKNGSLGNTGERTDGTTDKMCNIYDMASNPQEWITETSTSSEGPCVCRGGNSGSSDAFTSKRTRHGISKIDKCISFRPILYCGTGS